jgi:hypothetical protein
VIRIEGWRATALLVGLAVGGVILAVVLTVALFWIGLGLVALIGVGLLHLIYLPRAAAFLRLPVLHLVLGLLPLLALAGWGIAGAPSGAIGGLLVWALGLAAPRLAAAYLARRYRLRAGSWAVGAADAWRPSGPVVTLAGGACPRCGQVAYGDDAADCARCGAPLRPALPG